MQIKGVTIAELVDRLPALMAQVPRPVLHGDQVFYPYLLPPTDPDPRVLYICWINGMTRDLNTPTPTPAQLTERIELDPREGDPTHAAATIRLLPLRGALDVEVREMRPYAADWAAALQTVIGEMAPLRKPGRPAGSYKYRDREAFKQRLRDVARGYWLGKRRLPSRATLARALDTDDATLNAALTRFALTDADLQQMVENLRQIAED
jgi:hypothetical protein